MASREGFAVVVFDAVFFLDRCATARSRITLCFYEKVIKVKADVAALHIFFLRHQRCCVGWRGELSRALFLGVHLDP